MQARKYSALNMSISQSASSPLPVLTPVYYWHRAHYNPAGPPAATVRCSPPNAFFLIPSPFLLPPVLFLSDLSASSFPPPRIDNPDAIAPPAYFNIVASLFLCFSIFFSFPRKSPSKSQPQLSLSWWATSEKGADLLLAWTRLAASPELVQSNPAQLCALFLQEATTEYLFSALLQSYSWLPVFSRLIVVAFAPCHCYPKCSGLPLLVNTPARYHTARQGASLAVEESQERTCARNRQDAWDRH